MQLPSGGTVIQIEQINREFANAVILDGAYYFTQQRLFDCFQLEDDIKKRRKAVDTFLKFKKWLDKKDCELIQFGIVPRNPAEIEAAKLNPEIKVQFVFTYQVQSKRFNNQPLKVDRVFELDIPVLAMPNLMVDYWLAAHEDIPKEDIRMIANGG